MMKPGNLLKAAQNRRGATAVIVAICLVMLIGFAALAVDVGYLYATRNELQNVADAGALAGAGYLGSVYETLSYSEQQGYTFNRNDVVNAVNQVSQKNRAAGVSIYIRVEEEFNDIVIGTGAWVDNNGDGKYDEFKITPTLITPDAVRVTARRDGSANGPVTTFFGRIFKLLSPDPDDSQDTKNVTAVATAALTGSSKVEKGELKTPFALSECVFPNDCKDLIDFYPTTESCAGWHNFFDAANANSMDEKAIGLIAGDGDGSDWDGDGTVDNPCLLSPCGQGWIDHFFDMSKDSDSMVTPETTIWKDEYNFQGGTVGSLFLGGVLDSNYDGFNEGGIIGDEKHPAPFPALFDYFRYRDNDLDITDDEGNVIYHHDEIWTTTVPVFKDEVCCMNPNTAITIVGFAKIVIFMPNPPPDKTVSVKVDCNQSFLPGRGGGAISTNVKGTIPNLVE